MNRRLCSVPIACFFLLLDLVSGQTAASNADNRFSVSLHGVLRFDAVSLDQHEGGLANVEIRSEEVRGLEVSILGRFASDFRYRLQADFAHDQVEYKDIYLRYEHEGWSLIGGQFWPIPSLVSSSFVSAIELPATRRVFQGRRQIGLAVRRETALWTTSIGLFDGTINGFRQERSRTYAARATLSPILEAKRLLHFGASIRQRRRDDDDGFFSYSVKPHFRLGDSFIDSGELGRRELQLGFEFAGVVGPMSWESECVSLKVTSPDELDRSRLGGCYVMASWMITGEGRPYNAGSFKNIVVDRPVEHGGPGAWQMAARFDVIDLMGNSVSGGKQNGWTGSALWHLNDYLRLVMEYNCTKITAGIHDGTRVHGVGFRVQIHW